MLFVLSVAERNNIMCAGPYTLANRPVIVKNWTSDFDFQSEILKVIPLWVHFPSLPLNCWGLDSLSRIGSTIGTPLFADECTSQQSQIVTRSLAYKTLVEDPSGKQFEKCVKYEWEPPFCPKCQRIGHVCVTENQVQNKAPVKRRWVPKKVVTPVRDVQQPVVCSQQPVEEANWSVPKRSTPRILVQGTVATVSIANPFDILPPESVFDNETNEEEQRNQAGGGDPILFGSL